MQTICKDPFFAVLQVPIPYHSVLSVLVSDIMTATIICLYTYPLSSGTCSPEVHTHSSEVYYRPSAYRPISASSSNKKSSSSTNLPLSSSLLTRLPCPPIVPSISNSSPSSRVTIEIRSCRLLNSRNEWYKYA